MLTKDLQIFSQVNRIVDYIMQCIYRSDFTSLQNFWHHLNKRFFSRLTYESLNTAYRIENNILRLYLVHASRQGRQDEVKAFFEKMSDALHDKKEWKDWFSEFSTLPDTCSEVSGEPMLPLIFLIHRSLLPLLRPPLHQEPRTESHLQTLLQQGVAGHLHYHNAQLLQHTLHLPAYPFIWNHLTHTQF